ncbi:MAG: endonuclease/exonuclease/phosphatase family protein [Chlorobi bacterium]|nr:endonuclease/exonuclease/phosphatase family protein [Chlorobiota bacterium]
MKIKLIFLLLIVSFSPLKKLNSQNYKAGAIAFYNLENLFDTIDSPNVRDTEFTPAGRKKWTGDKYWEKIHHMATVISKIGSKEGLPGPAVIGVSEIENRGVLEDLVNDEALKEQNYQIVHYDSPDKRGIDVALLYQPRYFKVTNSRAVPLLIKGDDGKRLYTRDQLVVTGFFDGEEMHFIVNHWPSRRGGEARSRHLRDAAAQLTRSLVDSILNIDSKAKIAVMGDLNDDPINESLMVYLRAVGDKKKLKEGDMYNPMYKMYKKGIGSLAYRDNWNLFDQIIISQAFLGNDYSTYKFRVAHVFNDKMLINKTGRYKGYPHRTYVGDTYKAGYSDHLPVYIIILKEVK